MKVQFQSDKAPDSIEQQLLAAATKYAAQQEGVDEETQESLKGYLAQVVGEATEILKQNIAVHGVAYYDYDPRQHAPHEPIDTTLSNELESLATATANQLSALGRMQLDMALSAQERVSRDLVAPCLAYYQERVARAMGLYMEGGEGGQVDEGYAEEMKNQMRRGAELLAQVNLDLPRLQIELDAAVDATQPAKPPKEGADPSSSGDGTSHKDKSKQKRRSQRLHPYNKPENS